MRLNLRRVQPGALFGSFMGILDIKLGKFALYGTGSVERVSPRTTFLALAPAARLDVEN